MFVCSCHRFRTWRYYIAYIISQGCFGKTLKEKRRRKSEEQDECSFWRPWQVHEQ